MKRILLIATLSLTIAACASNPDKIQTSYVSSAAYQSYSCEQVGSELRSVTRRANELYTKLKKERSADNAQMAVGMILFWPALLFLEGGDSPEAGEYAQLKGQRQALEQAAIEKKCDPSIIPTAAPPS